MPQISRTTSNVSSDLIDRAAKAVAKLPETTTSGFYKLPQNLELFELSQTYGANLQRFNTLGILGIGGSSLGPKVIAQMLPAPGGSNGESGREIFVCENVDPLSFDQKLGKANFETTHWLVISKSGKTLETLSQLSLLVPKLNALGLSLGEYLTVISDPVSNPLTDWAAQNGVTHLPIPADVGGRFSVLTPVGLVPAAFLGHSLEEMRQGAVEASLDTENVALFVAQILASFKREEWITVFWGYSDLMTHFGGWVQQLWAESLAKTKSRSGAIVSRVSTPVPLLGANDQHSILQQVMEGAHDKFVCFFSVEEAEKAGSSIKEPIGLPGFLTGQTLGRILSAERRATQDALKTRGVESLTLAVRELTPRALGRLFFFFQMSVAAVAEALDINAFDQPGVELGKRLAFEILEREKRWD